jgi:CRP/FNR family transcriptional regulator, cyclic AMP receptor protein
MPYRTKFSDRRFVPAGQMVIAEGLIGNRAFLIEQGRVEAFTCGDNGKEHILGHIGPGGIVGEMAMLGDGIRNASVRTLEDTVLLAFSEEDMRNSIGLKDGLFDAMVRVMGERLTERDSDIMAFEQKTFATLRALADHPSFQRELTPVMEELRITLSKLN